MATDTEKLKLAQTAVADYLRDKSDIPVSVSPHSTLHTCCVICGSVYKKPWSEKANTLCQNGCYWILNNHAAWNGRRNRIKFFTAAAVPLFASYKTYDKLVAAGRALDAQAGKVKV
jgi:hypothetical protein